MNRPADRQSDIVSTVRKHVFLVGFMGSGKSTVGPELAARLAIGFHDLDDLISAAAGKTIARIFEESGEADFRRLETQAIEATRGLNPAVIALGGGAFVARENRDLIDGLGLSVWLNCPLDLCLERIRSDRGRPLLGSDVEMKSLFEARAPAYALADVSFDTGALSPTEVAEQIAGIIEPVRRSFG